MKILVVCQYYKPEPFRISDICEEIAARGHDVLVVTGTPNYPEGKIYPGYENGARRDEVINGVRVHRCPIHPRGQGALHRFLNYYSFVFSSGKYLSGLKEDFDLVFVNQLSPVMMAQPALKWAKRNGRKCLLYCLDLWPDSLYAGGIGESSPVFRFFARVSKKIYSSADEILVTSGGFISYMQDVLGVKTPISHLPQYAELQFDDIPPVKEHEAPYNFLFAGNIGAVQSLDTIIEAARLLADDKRIKFSIVGGGTDLDNCIKKAEGLENIKFYGRKELSEMPEFYAAADAMLVSLKNSPGLSRTLPGKVQSYMAAGRAVIGSIGGETPRVIKEADCGFCAEPENPEELAETVRKMADEPRLFISCGSNARLYYENNFRREIFINKLLEAMERNAAGK